MNTLTYRGYGISKEDNDDLLKELRNELHVSIYNTMTNTNEDAGFDVYIESSKKIYIPKHYGLQRFGIPESVKTYEGENMKEDVSFVGFLRENQMEPVQTYLKYANDPLHMGGILQLPPGWGKTVMALYIATYLRKKTIVIVHKNFLLKQWQERIQQYVSNVTIGIIQQNNIVVEDCDIVLGSLQTLISRKVDLSSFGLMIIDECHHMGAQGFSQVFHKINCKYTLGLSATVTRNDGLTKVFKWFMGDVVFKAKRNKEDQKDLQIKIVHYENEDPRYSFEHCIYNGKPNMSRMLNNICAYIPRTNVICRNIVELYGKEPNRCFLILSDRRGHLEDIFGNLVEMGICGDHIGYYMGKMKSEDLKESETKQFLLGTYNMVSEGFDLPKLDTLIMASPKSNVEQSIGRIQRKHISEREYIPLVIDIVDHFSVFKNQAKKRMTFYKKSCFSVDGALLDNTSEVQEVDVLPMKGISFFKKGI